MTMLRAMSDEAVEAIYHYAKKDGLRPFFRDPKSMIELREEVERRRKERAT